MKARRRYFTLLEVLVSMAVFAVMMLGLMQFFSSAQKLWTATSSRNAASYEAKMLTRILTVDLANIFYEDPVNPHLPERKKFIAVHGASEPYEGIGFAAYRNEKAHKDAFTKLTAVFYRKKGNIVETRVVTDNAVPDSLKWVTTRINDPGESILQTLLKESGVAGDDRNLPTTGSDYEINGSKDWEKISDNVLRFTVRLLDRKGTIITETMLENGAFPYMVQITLITINEETARNIRLIKGDAAWKNCNLGSFLEADGTVKVKADEDSETATIKQLIQDKLQVAIQGIVLERGI